MALMIQAFTGPSSLTSAQELWCIEELGRIAPGEIRRSGAAHGLDTLVALEYPADQVHLFVPVGEWFNERLLCEEAFGMKIDYITGGYRTRNEFLVAGADELHAFVKRMDFYRSGEWMTVNIAKRLNVPVQFHLLP